MAPSFLDLLNVPKDLTLEFMASICSRIPRRNKCWQTGLFAGWTAKELLGRQSAASC